MSGALVIQGYLCSRDDTGIVLGSYLVLFAGYLFLGKSRLPVAQIFLLGLFFRLVLLLSLPGLSDDLFRFIWDGRLMNHGIHPFAAVPSSYFEQGLPSFLSESLYHRLNSPDYFTVYPPVAQYIFLIATRFFPDSILGSAVIIRCFLLLAEVFTFFVLGKLCLREKDVAWYWLNPLVILEITGNLHMEGLSILFLLLVLRGLILAGGVGIPLGLAIATKLNPLLLLPAALRFTPKDRRRKLVIYTSVTLLILFLPLFFGPFFPGLLSSLSLYFHTFEFNGSLYYLVRQAGCILAGYNIIGMAAPTLAVIATVLIIWLALWKNSTKEHAAVIMGFSWLIYLLCSTTVHPWYIIPLLVFLLIRGFFFPVLWSLLIFLTYAGYTKTGYQENLWIVALEYISVLTFAYVEIHRYVQKKKAMASRPSLSVYSTDTSLYGSP